MTPVRDAQTTRVYTTSPYGSTVGEVKYVAPSQTKTDTVQTTNTKPAPSPAIGQQSAPSQPTHTKFPIPGPALPESKPAATVATKTSDVPKVDKSLTSLTPASKPAVADTTLAKPAIAAAQPTDWRQSWGKADDHKSTPLPPPPPLELASEPAKPVLPHADSKQSDPLQAPDRFTQRTLESKLATRKETTSAPTSASGLNDSSVTRTPVPSQSTTTVRESNKPALLPATTSAVMEAPKTAPSVASAPVMTSVNPTVRPPASYMSLPVPTMPDVRYVPVPPSGPPQIMPQRLLANGYSGMPQSKALGAPPTTSDPEAVNAFVATPSGATLAKMSNAFSNPGEQTGNAMSEPMPPMGAEQQYYASNSFGSMPPVQNSVPNMANPAMMQAAYQRSMAAAASSQSMAAQASAMSPQQTLAALHESLYPSQRERAAEALVNVDWRTNAGIVPALLSSAREDPAATVRASCVRCLAKMKVNTALVIGAIQELRADTDARVRHEADLALQVLVPDSRSMLTPAVQPVGGVIPGK